MVERALCFAKLNFTLEILGRRPDGYHDITSVAHTISLADELSAEPADTLALQANGLDAGVPVEDNLVVRAARLLAAEANRPPAARLHLRKHIPVAAGLGGGSTDAAAALVLLNRVLWANLSDERLARLAAQLGSDVPFFLHGGAAVMRGRGELLDLLPPCPGQWFILLVPPHGLAAKTAALYAALQSTDFSAGAATDQAAATLRRGDPLTDADCSNAFARAARASFPSLGRAWDTAEAAAGRRFHLSGAGPALFAFAADERDASTQAQRLARPDLPAFAVQTVRSAHEGAQPAP